MRCKPACDRACDRNGSSGDAILTIRSNHFTTVWSGPRIGTGDRGTRYRKGWGAGIHKLRHHRLKRRHGTNTDRSVSGNPQGMRTTTTKEPRTLLTSLRLPGTDQHADLAEPSPGGPPTSTADGLTGSSRAGSHSLRDDAETERENKLPCGALNTLPAKSGKPETRLAPFVRQGHRFQNTACRTPGDVKPPWKEPSPIFRFIAHHPPLERTHHPQNLGAGAGTREEAAAPGRAGRYRYSVTGLAASAEESRHHGKQNSAPGHPPARAAWEQERNIRRSRDSAGPSARARHRQRADPRWHKPDPDPQCGSRRQLPPG